MNIWLKLLLLTLLLVYAALVYISGETYRDASEEPMVEVLPMTFAHKDHIIQQCVECHHNWEDDIGPGGFCIDCHLRDDDVAYRIEDQFHDLCRSCHEKEHMAGNTAGPLRHCADCHTSDHLP